MQMTWFLYCSKTGALERGHVEAVDFFWWTHPLFNSHSKAEWDQLTNRTVKTLQNVLLGFIRKKNLQEDRIDAEVGICCLSCPFAS